MIEPSRTPAVVFGCLQTGEFRLILWPSVGLADGGIPVNVAAELVPPDCRMPNTLLWALTQGGLILSIERRE